MILLWKTNDENNKISIDKNNTNAEIGIVYETCTGMDKRNELHNSAIIYRE